MYAKSNVYWQREVSRLSFSMRGLWRASRRLAWFSLSQSLLLFEYLFFSAELRRQVSPGKYEQVGQLKEQSMGHSPYQHPPSLM